MPDMPLIPTRGLTTQKRVSERAKDLAGRSRSMDTTTCDRSLDSAMSSTLPMGTSRYLTWVLFASRPSAFWNDTVMRGPCAITWRSNRDAPIKADTMGSTQITDRCQRDLCTMGSAARTAALG
jgi:hypothetical protein